MLAHLLVCTSLIIGQTTPSTPFTEEVSREEAPVPAVPPERWLLMKTLQGTYYGSLLDSQRIQVSGWTDADFTASTDKLTNGPMGMNYLANQFDLQQNWLRIERPVITTGTTEPTFGFRIDTILPGTDYFFTIDRALFDGQLTANNGKPSVYGFDPVQFYAEAYFPTFFRGMDVKFGRVFAQYGVENIGAAYNFFESHAYAFIYDPFTQTGLITTTQVTDAWSVQAGLVVGNDVFLDQRLNSPYSMGSVKWAPPGGRDTVLASFILGSGRYNAAQSFHNPQIFDLVYTHKVNARTNFTFEGLYGFTNNVPDLGFANWFSILNYLTYDFTPRLSGGTRVEFFNDVQGQRTGFKGLYSTLTVGLNFKLLRNVVFRPEVRYDYNDESRPFENQQGLLTSAFDVLVRW